MIYIEEINDSVEMWTALQEKYSPKTQMTFLQTFREFIEIKMNEAIDIIKQYLQKLERFKRCFKEHEEKMSDIIYNDMLLSNVSEIYKVVVSILESQNQFISTKIVN